MKIPTILIATAALGLAGCGTYGPYGEPYGAPPPGPYGTPPPGPYGDTYGPATGTSLVTQGDKRPFGLFLVDAEGRSLYILEGTRGQGGMNRCSGECLSIWPPVRATGPLTAGGAVDARRLTTVPGPGGPQVAYDGWPLYYYNRDRGPGDTTGQAVSDRWGYWYLLAPSGAPIRSGGY
jgi:predicted lipoprotein with Yx(FWY)xxD motif